MNANPPKKSPATATNEPQDSNSKTRSAYARTNSTRKEAEKTATSRKTGSAPKRRSQARNTEPPPPDCAHTPSQKVRQAPDRSGAFFMHRTFPLFRSPT